MRISDWSSDVCSSDLPSGSYIRVRSGLPPAPIVRSLALGVVALTLVWIFGLFFIERQDVSEYFRWYVVHYWVEGVWEVIHIALVGFLLVLLFDASVKSVGYAVFWGVALVWLSGLIRSEEHTSELQSLMRISYAVFCLKKKNTTQIIHIHTLGASTEYLSTQET